MPLGGQVLPSESSPFTIRQYVSTVRCKDFSKCWPFSYRILERCFILGIEVELPPLEPTLKSHMCGRCNISSQLPLNNGSDCIVSCTFGQRSSKEDFSKFDLKDSPKISRDLAMEKVFCGDGEALNMVEEKVGVNVREHFLATQKLNKAAEMKPLTENVWDSSTVDCKLDIIHSSGSQVVVGRLLESDGTMDLPSPQATNIPGFSLLERDIRDCGLYPVVLKGSSGVPKVHSNKAAVLCDIFSESDRVADNLLQSSSAIADHGVHQGDKEAFYKPSTLLKESEPIGYFHKVERDKNGILRSNPDTSMLQVCPLCLKFQSYSNTALNAHIDHCLVVEKADAIRPPKKRLKVKKMRSMVDIYASAPACTLKDLEMSSKICLIQRSNH